MIWPSVNSRLYVFESCRGNWHKDESAYWDSEFHRFPCLKFQQTPSRSGSPELASLWKGGIWRLINHCPIPWAHTVVRFSRITLVLLVCLCPGRSGQSDWHSLSTLIEQQVERRVNDTRLLSEKAETNYDQMSRDQTYATELLLGKHYTVIARDIKEWQKSDQAGGGKHTQ